MSSSDVPGIERVDLDGRPSSPKLVLMAKRGEGVDTDHFVEWCRTGQLRQQVAGWASWSANIVQSRTDAEPAWDCFIDCRFADSPGLMSAWTDLSGLSLPLVGSWHAYTAVERVHVDRVSPPGDGTPTSLLKVYVPLQRERTLSHDDFRLLWINEHVATVLGGVMAELRYTTSEVVASLTDHAEPWDGFAEIWYESVEALRGQSRERLAELAASRQKFIGKQATHFVAEHTWVRDIDGD